MRLRCEAPATPRERLVESDRPGDREERRTLAVSTEGVPSLTLTLARSAAVATATATATAPAAQRVATREAEPVAAAAPVAAAETAAQPTGEGPGLAQVGRGVRAGEDVRGERAGECPRAGADARTALTPARAGPARAGPARLLERWRGHGHRAQGRHGVRDVTRGADACQVRAGAAPATLAAGRNTALGGIRRTGPPTIAQALRRYAMYPVEALALLGLTLPGTA